MKIKKQSSYSIGDRVRIVPLDELKRCLKRRSDSEIDEWAGKIVTIRKECPICGGYWTEGDNPDWCWTHDMIEGKVIELKEVKRAAEVNDWIKIVNAHITGGEYTNGALSDKEEIYACPKDVEFNIDVQRMVCVHKLFGEKLPDWIGEGDKK